MGGRIKVKKATKPKKGPTKYPFRFYGHDPDDYFDSLQYEVRFESAPDRAMRADIADQATHQLFDSAAEFHGAWHWSESFVRFTALAHGSSSTGGAMHAIAKMLRSLHDVAPIAQVVAFHVREPGRGAWDRATLKAQPDPDPGPPYDPPVAYGYPYGAPRAIDATLPVATVDDEVEELRRTLERDLRAKQHRASVGGEALSPFAAERVETVLAARPTFSEAQLATFEDTDVPEWHPARAFGQIHIELRRCGIVYLDDEGRRRVVTGIDPPDSPQWGNHFVVGPWTTDGSVLWFATNFRIYKVDIADGVAHVAYEASGRIDHVEILGDRWVLWIRQALELLDPSGWTVLDRQLTMANPWIGTARDGALVIAGGYITDVGLQAWTIVDDRFVEVATYKAPLHSPLDIDGKVVCRVGNTGDYVSLDDIDAKLAAARGT
jgi:hypothetical protein